MLSADTNLVNIAKLIGGNQDSNPDKFLVSLLVEAKLRFISVMQA